MIFNPFNVTPVVGERFDFVARNAYAVARVVGFLARGAFLLLGAAFFFSFFGSILYDTYLTVPGVQAETLERILPPLDSITRIQIKWLLRNLPSEERNDFINIIQELSELNPQTDRYDLCKWMGNFPSDQRSQLKEDVLQFGRPLKRQNRDINILSLLQSWRNYDPKRRQAYIREAARFNQIFIENKFNPHDIILLSNKIYNFYTKDQNIQTYDFFISIWKEVRSEDTLSPFELNFFLFISEYYLGITDTANKSRFLKEIKKKISAQGWDYSDEQIRNFILTFSRSQSTPT